MTENKLASSDFNASSTTDEVISGIDLSGKIALVTGASAGLGVEVARVLAAAGAHVIMAARNPQKLQAAAETIRAGQADARLSIAEVDLADLDSVRRCAGQLIKDYPQLDLLINNAGIMACPLQRTAQGHELQFGTNHLGHFLLTGLILSLLTAAPSARVVNLSSGGHKFGPVNFDDIDFERGDYDKWLAYGQAKTANALFSVELNRRMQSQGLTSFAVHPGAIVTELGRHLTNDDIKKLMSEAKDFGTMSYKSIPQGAATSVWAATSSQLDDRGGLYLEDCHIASPASEKTPDKGYSPYAMDADLAAKLWLVSEQMVGQTFA